MIRQKDQEMASKKGMYVTVGILAVITIASFMVWVIPQNNQTDFQVSDFESHLDGVKAIHTTIGNDLEMEFQRMMDGNIEPQEYIAIADISSNQIKSQITQLLNSKPPDMWVDSYSQYIEALRQFNSYIRETIVTAKLMQDGKTGQELEEVLEKAQKFKEDSTSTIKLSDMSRP
jgi:hypothetical protein